MTDYAGAYRGVRERVASLARAASPEQLDAVVPATPLWSAHDVLAHMVGVGADVLAQRLDGVATDPWTAAQVEERRGRSSDDLLAEWDDVGPRFEDVIRGLPDAVSGQIVFDAVTHEHDLRHAFARLGCRDSDAVAIAFDWIVTMRGGASASLRIETEAGTFGGDDPEATVRTSRFEFVRATVGRRSVAQVAALAWEPEPRPDLVLGAAIFAFRDGPLVETA